MTLLALSLATGIGLGATWMTATRGIDIATVRIGPWTARPQSGTSKIDPYARAAIARSGELPIGIGDGVGFRTDTDDDGRPLDGLSRRREASWRPDGAGFSTLTVIDAAGRTASVGVFIE